MYRITLPNNRANLGQSRYVYAHTHTPHQCYCCNKPLKITNQYKSYLLHTIEQTTILYITHTVQNNNFATCFQQLHYKLTFLPVHSVSHVRLSGRLACHPSPVVQCCRRRSGDSPLLGGSWWQVWRHGDLHVLKWDFVPLQFMIHDFQKCFILSNLSMKPNRRVNTYLQFLPKEIHCKKKPCIFEWVSKTFGCIDPCSLLMTGFFCCMGFSRVVCRKTCGTMWT